MSSMRLGAIVAQGLNDEQGKARDKTSFWHVCDDELDPKQSGRSDLRSVALRTIIAAMFDILRAREATNVPGESAI